MISNALRRGCAAAALVFLACTAAQAAPGLVDAAQKGDLKAVKEADSTLLDRTMVLYGSNLGDASTHVNTNMPVIFAGGGFKHGQHLAFDTTPERNYPIANLMVSILQRMGLEQDKFATSTGTMRGLEMT